MRSIWASLFVLALGIIGCSGGGGTPISPESPSSPIAYERPATPGSLDSLPIIDGTTHADGTFYATGLMGAYELMIDPANMTADLVSKRLPTALGDNWTVSGIGFFTIAPCSDCLSLNSISLTAENYLQFNLAISHPFNPGVPTLPPSATNRLDLDVFDLALVVAPIGATPTNFGLMGANAYPGVLAGNQGYTTVLGEMTGDRAAMPYMLVVDDSVGGGSTWNEFPMGTDSFFDVFFDLNTMPTLTFDLYLIMGYGQSAVGKSQRLTPTYFNPAFNRKPAWKVNVTPPQGSDPPAIGNTWQDNDDTTLFNVTVEVYDWQHGNTNIEDPLVNTNAIKEASDVSMVSVEIPGMNNTLPSATTETSGTGEPTDPLIYEVPVANENLLTPGEYVGLVKVTDTRVPTSVPPGDGIDFLIDSPDGILLNNYGVAEYATYQTFIATVVLGCGPITGSITSPSCPLSGVASGSTIDFVVSASSDNGGDPIVSYECSYDGGTIWIADNPVGSGIFDDVGPFTNPSCPTPTDYYYTVEFRATDSCSPPNITKFAECEVNVNVCCGPLTGTGQIISPSCPVDIRNGGQLTFQVGGYTSTNATVTYWVDWENDSTWDDSTTTGTFAPHTFVNTSGSDRTDTVAFKAVDDCTPPNEEVFTATCDVTIHVAPSPVGNITITVNRTATGSYGYAFTTAAPWTIGWTAATNAHAYAIYYDNNPTSAPAPGGYTDGLVYVGETTSTSYTVPSSHLPTNRLVPGTTYVVRSRSVSGDPLSEATNSQPALIIANGFETLTTTNQIIGVGNTGEGWLAASELNPASYSYTWFVSSSYTHNGTRDAYFRMYNAGPTRAGRWFALSKTAPMNLPNATVRILDISQSLPSSNSAYWAMCIGTCPVRPVTPWAWPVGAIPLEWAYSSSGGPSPAFTPYNSTNAFLAGTFWDVNTSGNYCWRFSTNSRGYRIGGNVNNGGSPLHDYVAIGLTSDVLYGSAGWQTLDDIAILIY